LPDALGQMTFPGTGWAQKKRVFNGAGFEFHFAARADTSLPINLSPMPNSQY
jgi:hypothetical protein